MGYILVVDDIKQNRDILSRRLIKKGYEIIEAESGTKCLQIIDKENIDLVLLDIRMPELDGYQVLEIIRKSYSPTDLPVIMVTAESETDSVVKSLGLGADDYVTKPVNLPVLLARIENKLSVSKMVKDKLAEKEDSSSSPISAEKILDLIKSGENQYVEFKSSLRWNIHTGKVGKEIEIAWLKSIVAFINTGGGTLLVGVSDDGLITGTKIDKFANDDKYLLHVNNLIKSFIGMEYISHISFDLIPVAGEKVLWVGCRTSSEAVFLKNGTEDEFYARFGPSSRKLSTKEVLVFLQNRS